MRPLYTFDKAYVQRLQNGDASTEEHFCEYFGPLICIKANQRIKGGSQTAEDIRQETLIRVLRAVRKGEIEHAERLGAYVSSVANHVLLEMFRNVRRMETLPEGSAELPSRDVGVENQLIRDERVTQVREAISALPPKDRDLLRVLLVEDSDKDSICREFQVTREHLRVLLHRARTRLRAAMTK